MSWTPSRITEDMKPTNQKAFLMYKAFMKHPLMNEGSKIMTSKGMIVNLKSPVYALRVHISKLPQEEQDKILALKKTQYKISTSAMSWKRKAYQGLRSLNKYGDMVSVSGGGRKSNIDLKQAEIIELFGRMFSVSEVHEVCIKEWKLTNVTLKMVQEFRSRNISMITQKQEEFKRDFSDIRLGIKKSRLEELVWLYNKRKRLYELSNKQEDHRLLLITLEQVRKEAEGDSLRINGKIEIDQEMSIQNHIRLQILPMVNIKQIVLSRVAARLGKNPLLLEKAISESYYNTYLNTKHELNDSPPLPTSETYDFNEIDHLVRENNIREEREGKALQLISPVQESRNLSIKELLIQRLKGMEGNVNEKKNDILFKEKLGNENN